MTRLPSPRQSPGDLNPRRVVYYHNRIVIVGCNEPQFLDAIKARLRPGTYFHNDCEGTVTVVGDDRNWTEAQSIVSEVYAEAGDWYAPYSLARQKCLTVTMGRPVAKRLDAARDAFYARIKR